MARRASLGLVMVAIAGASLVASSAFQAAPQEPSRDAPRASPHEASQRAAQQATAWPPSVQRVPEIAPARSAEEELATFHLPPGYRVDIVASEPLVQDPIAIDYDADGRLFVLEMPGFAADETMADSLAPTGRVVMLEDLDDDGRMDRRTVFLDRLVLPRALKALDGALLVGEPPNLWLARDTNGDGKADEKRRIREDFGRRGGNLEHDANGLLWALDNVIYTSEHDWHLRRRRDGSFEILETLPRGQWGVSMDDAGRLFRNFNTEALFVDLVPARYFLRNPHLVRTRGLYESLVDPNRTAIWPVRPTRGINRGYRDGLLRPDGTAAYYAGAASPLIYRGDRLPAELSGDAFVADSPTNLVHRLRVVDEGNGRMSAHDAYAKGEFLASTDERFRPVGLYSAPDGTLQVVDMYRGVVQDLKFQTDYLRDYIVRHRLALPVGRGRIFRVLHETTRRDRQPRLSRETPEQLVTRLSHPNGWWRDTAQRLLVERGATAVAPALKTLARDAADPRARLHALWTLDGLDAIDRESVQHALRDSSPDVRASAVRLSERWLRAPASSESAAWRDVLTMMMEDANLHVRRQLAATLGELPEAERAAPLLTMIERFGDDAMVVDAAVSGLAGQELALLESLLAARTPAQHDRPTREDAIAMLTGAAARGGDAIAMARLVALATDEARGAAERLALLSGLEAGLSVTTDITANRGGVPAGATGRAAIAGGAFGPTSSGEAGASVSRTAAAGAAASPGSNGAVRTAAPRARQAGFAMRAPVALAEEPVALTQLAAIGSKQSSDATARNADGAAQAQLAMQILARLTWPGKPAPAGPSAAPLTAAERARQTAGAEIYARICVACHQADGRGKPAVAPPLAGSPFTLAPAAIPARILLAGKDGRIGLMPPLATLSDEEMAAVLTYVRRAWGNATSAVAPALVKEVRALTATRAKPWTDAELKALAAPRN